MNHLRLKSTLLLAVLVSLTGCVAGGVASGPGNSQQATSNEASCFISYNGIERQMCEAYRENKSCFMAFKNATDQGWCQHLKEKKSCFMALNGAAKSDCEAGRIPRDHDLWLRGGPQ